MKKQLLILGLVSSATLCSHARTTLPAAHTDTVNAVHRMFSQHRTGGIVWSLIGAAFAGRIIGAAAGGSGDAGGAAAGVVVLGGIPAGIGIGKLVRFSAGQESAILSAYDAGKALPHYVQRRLKKTKYFTMG